MPAFEKSDVRVTLFFVFGVYQWRLSVFFLIHLVDIDATKQTNVYVTKVTMIMTKKIVTTNNYITAFIAFLNLSTLILHTN